MSGQSSGLAFLIVTAVGSAVIVGVWSLARNDAWRGDFHDPEKVVLAFGVAHEVFRIIEARDVANHEWQHRLDAHGHVTPGHARRAHQSRPCAGAMKGWSRWFPTTPAVDDARFQGADEPHPRHWRRFPLAWPPVEADDPAVRDTLASGIADLPRRWRDVVIARDMQGRRPAEVSEQQGLTPAQQRAMLGRARGMLWERLARRFAGDAE